MSFSFIGFPLYTGGKLLCMKRKDTLIFLDISDIERMVQAQEHRTKLMDVINRPLTVLNAHIGPSKFPETDKDGNILYDEHGEQKHGECAVITCKLLDEDEIKTFSTASKPIIRQLRMVQDHFMRNKVPREFWGFTGIIKRDGKCLKIFTSRNAMTKPVEEHTDRFQTLEEAGSPIIPEDCPFGSVEDEETKEYIAKTGDQMTLLAGDPTLLSNDTTLPLKKRLRFKRIEEREEREHENLIEEGI